MNYTILRFLFIISCALASTFLNGQNPGHKFGKVSPSELKAKICPIDADAKAYYIFDKGVYEIKLDNAVIHKNNTALNGGYFNFNQRHYRKKIIEASSDDDEKIEIFLAHSNGHKESISSFMGYVHYLKDGKVEKEKIEFKSALTESIAPDVDRVSINLPELEDGSVLEIKYTVKSPFLRNLDTWYFQDELPKMYCELQLKIPEFYVYDYHQLGYLELQMERRLDSFNREITIRDNGLKSNRRLSTSSSGQSSYAQKGELSYELENRKYWVKNVPAMSDYKFVRSKKKFLSRLEFGLNHTTFLNGATLGIGVDWTERNKILLQHAAFGRNLSSYDHLAE